MTNSDAVFKSIVDECREDYVGLWSVIAEVRTTIADPSALVEETLALVKRLILEGGVIAGSFNTDLDDKFHEWNMPVDEIVAKIRREWEKLPGDPNLGDIVWFTSEGEGTA